MLIVFIAFLLLTILVRDKFSPLLKDEQEA